MTTSRRDARVRLLAALAAGIVLRQLLLLFAVGASASCTLDMHRNPQDLGATGETGIRDLRGVEANPREEQVVGQWNTASELQLLSRSGAKVYGSAEAAYLGIDGKVQRSSSRSCATALIVEAVSPLGNTFWNTAPQACQSIAGVGAVSAASTVVARTEWLRLQGFGFGAEVPGSAAVTEIMIGYEAFPLLYDADYSRTCIVARLHFAGTLGDTTPFDARCSLSPGEAVAGLFPVGATLLPGGEVPGSEVNSAAFAVDFRVLWIPSAATVRMSDVKLTVSYRQREATFSTDVLPLASECTRWGTLSYAFREPLPSSCTQTWNVRGPGDGGSPLKADLVGKLQDGSYRLDLSDLTAQELTLEGEQSCTSGGTSTPKLDWFRLTCRSSKGAAL